MVSTKRQRRAKRRAESLIFEAVEAADAGDLRLAGALLHRSVGARTARTRLEAERTWLEVARRRPRADHVVTVTASRSARR